MSSVGSYGNDDGKDTVQRGAASNKSAISTLDQQIEVYKNLDYMLIPIFVIILGGVTVFLVALTVGDWDYWQDWRDRRWWPLVTPVSLVVGPAVFSYFFWKYFRLPVAATAITLGYMFGVIVSRYMNFHVFANFPINFISPSTFIGMAIILDATLLISRSFYFAGLIGAFLFAIVVYPLNWPMAASFHVPIEYHGTLVTVADLMGFQYIRTAMPEYVRIIEESTLRTFGEAVTPLTAFFAGFVTILNYYLWVWIGSKLTQARWLTKLI